MKLLREEHVSDDHLEQVLSTEQRSPTDQHPWVMVNMIATPDGAAAIEGTSGALGNTGDREVFRILRAQCDVIVAGAGTVRDEQYRTPSTPTGQLAEWRAERGQAPRPELCIVTRSMQLEPTPPAMSDPADDLPTLIATTHRRALEVGDEPMPWSAPTDVVGAGDDDVAPHALLDRLADRGHRVVLVEGGPRLLQQFASSGVIDEWNLTVAPTLSGTEPRLIPSALADPIPLHLDRVLRHDSHLFLRYLRSDSGTTKR